MQVGESTRRSLLYCLFRNGELVGNRETACQVLSLPSSRMSLLFQVQVHPIVLTCRSFTTWAMSMVAPYLLPPSLPPSSPWSQPSGLFLFVQINLCAGLCVCLGCPIHLLPLRDPFSCIGTFSHASS